MSGCPFCCFTGSLTPRCMHEPTARQRVNLHRKRLAQLKVTVAGSDPARMRMDADYREHIRRAYLDITRQEDLLLQALGERDGLPPRQAS